MISLGFSSTDDAACAAPPESLARFVATDPPKATSDEPFIRNGDSLKVLADYRGQGVVLNFWATWCPPCVKEMPALDRLAANDAGITVLAVSEDRGETEIVEKYFAVNRIANLDVLVDRRGRLAKSLGVGGLPTTLLIDDRGREVGRLVGIAEWDTPESRAFLRRCLDTDSP